MYQVFTWQTPCYGSERIPSQNGVHTSLNLWISSWSKSLHVSQFILFNSPPKLAEVRKDLSPHVRLCFALHHVSPNCSWRVCVRTRIVWQVQVLQCTNRILINLMKSLIGDFIKELVRWQITEASESQRAYKDRSPATLSLPGLKQ